MNKKNTVEKYMQLKGAQLRDLCFFLRDRGIKCSRQHIHGIIKGVANPREGSEVRKGICDFFGLDDSVLFGQLVFKDEVHAE